MPWTLRYLPTVPLSRRAHAPTTGQWDDVADADAALEQLPNKADLEVVLRGQQRPLSADTTGADA